MPPSPIVNMGNTCYMSACLQILDTLDIVNDSLIASARANRIRSVKGSLLSTWLDTRNSLQDGRLFRPEAMAATLKAESAKRGVEEFGGDKQQDAHELFIFILDAIHEEIEREVTMTVTGTAKSAKDELALRCYKEYRRHFAKSFSEIVKLTRSMEVTVVNDASTGRRLTLSSDPMSNLSLYVMPGRWELSDLVSSYCAASIVEDVDDEQGGKTTANRQIFFWSLPSVLIIHLQKDYSGPSLVTFPVDDLDMSKNVIGYKPTSYVYQLQGVLYHRGTRRGGHYIAAVRRGSDWYLCDDERITRTRPVDLISEYAYCLFYTRK